MRKSREIRRNPRDARCSIISSSEMRITTMPSTFPPYSPIPRQRKERASPVRKLNPFPHRKREREREGPASVRRARRALAVVCKPAMEHRALSNAREKVSPLFARHSRNREAGLCQRSGSRSATRPSYLESRTSHA
jgi:hypothetical protein